MTDQTYELYGVRVLEIAVNGPPLDAGAALNDLIADALGRDAGLVVVPMGRLRNDFFKLSSGMAGEMLQKFVTYGRRVAIVGDIARRVETNAALRDFVRESNRGEHVWFVSTQAELEDRLARAGG
jgi:hypothetical protein